MNRTRTADRRAGITLTEILISILIMGVGMASLATLFPVGLLRLREATRDSRSVLLAESAQAEVNARDLLNAETFSTAANNGATWYPWAPYGNNALNPTVKDWNIAAEGASPGVSATVFGPGLPFAYDPLWWSVNDFNTYNTADAVNPATYPEASRFGRGIGFLRTDPDGGVPSAHGLQRLTNFYRYVPASPWPLTYTMPSSFPPYGGTPPPEVLAEVAGDVFTSVDDVILQNGGNASQQASPLIPDLSAGASVRDYTYQWSVTARQVAAGQNEAYEADIIIHCQRPTGLDAAAKSFPDPYPGSAYAVSGERVVEAIWGYTTSPNAVDAAGYSTGDDRAVLLRWPNNSPLPDVRSGRWICDVTYERLQAVSDSRFGPASGATQPGQRANWYRVTQVGRPEPDPSIPGYTRMSIRVETPLRAMTQLSAGPPVVPVHVEAALIAPYVVQVFPTILYSR